jgi:acyl carrier protein
VIATPGHDPWLTAYVVGDGVSVPELRRDLMDVLPLAMIPARFVTVPRLPTARTGKVDRAALVALAEDGARADFVAPSGDVECWLAERFSELLGVERVSARDDLFALGGDSITAVRLAARIRDELGVDLTPRAVFAAGTIADLATAIVDQQLRAADPDDLLAALDALEA